MTPTTQFRIPQATKELFKDVCAYRQVSMCQIVIKSLERYITEATKDPVLLRHLKNKAISLQTGMVLDENKTWVPKETIQKEPDWRDLL